MLKFWRTTQRPRTLYPPLPGFDEVYYRYWYRDVENYGGSARDHYLTIGWKEGRDPSAGFSTDGYLIANADVRASGMNPLVHFIQIGLVENRKGWEKSTLAPPPRPLPVGHLDPQKLLAPPTHQS
jgi:hypothetical protein